MDHYRFQYPPPPFPETYHDFSAGSDALPWRGWLEAPDGHITGWVDLGGRIHRRTGEQCEETGKLSDRNGAWNAVRDAAAAAAKLPDDAKDCYWPVSPVACLLSLTLKQIDRSVRKANPLDTGRLRFLRSIVELCFFTANACDLGAVYATSEPVAVAAEPDAPCTDEVPEHLLKAARAEP